MLTEPTIIERPAEHYVAIQQDVTIPFDDVAQRVISDLLSLMHESGVSAAGPMIFKHNTVAMPDVDMDFGVIVAGPVAVRAPLVTGIVPAGRYAQLTHTGPYDGLIDANAALIGWAERSGIAWDMTSGPDGDRFAARLEIYPNGPDDEPDASKWETIVAIKIRD